MAQDVPGCSSAEGLCFLNCGVRRPRHPDTHSQAPRPLGTLISCYVRRHGPPATVAARPHIRVSPRALFTVRRGVRRARVNDRKVAHQPHVHVVRGEIGDRRRLRRVRKELLLVEERSVGEGAQKIIRQDFFEAADVGMLH